MIVWFGCPLPRIWGAYATALWFLVIVDDDHVGTSKRTLNHERIHVRQFNELWVLGMTVLYSYYYLRGRFRGLDHDAAYRANPFEVEAYAHAGDLDYLAGRERNAWRRYT